MSRLIGPDDRTVYLTAGPNRGKAMAQGLTATLYLDQAMTTLADVLTEAGAAVPGSTVSIDAYSQLPLIQFPDGVDTVWTSINGGPAVALYARSDDRLDQMMTVYNVRSYGKFTTPALTLAAIQAAMDACSTAGGGIVYAPPGTYQTNAPIVPRSNVRFRGAGESTIIQAMFNGHTIASSGALTNFTVEDMKFLGPVNQTVSTPTRTRSTSGPGADVAIWIDGDLDTATPGAGVITNVAVHRVIVEATTWLPIRLFGIRGTTKVTDCLFYNTMDAGFGFNHEVICIGNTSVMSADNGFSISRGNRKVTCIGNTVENAAYYGIWLSGFTGTAGPEDFTCSANTVRGCGQAGIVLMDAPTYGTVVGNTVDKMGYRGWAEVVDDTTCVGIMVQGDSASKTTPSTFTKGVVIAGNVIRNAPRAGIMLNGCTAIKVSENQIIDCGSAFFGDGVSSISSSFTSQNVGILLDTPATVTNCSITGNEVIDTRSPNYTNWAVVPLVSNTNTVFGNRMTGCRNSSNLTVPVRGTGIGLRRKAEEVIPRWAATNLTGITMVSGAIRWGYIWPQRNRTITQLSVSTGNTAAGATPSLVRYGIWQVAANGDLTNGVLTVNDTALLVAAGNNYPKALPQSVLLIEDQPYAIGALVVTAATAPTLAGALPSTGNDLAQDGRLSGVLTGQSDLATSYTAAQVSSTQSLIYAAALE